ncbi:hypothetical protein F511_39232 [Dorcoceras hygrometricum]|uniref:Uncharacterized protein n=1 Tax=Dorcoceras hygrometricum TaxID=472368 RepID=A0A2Z7CIT4_9LAMI|nr:hypothetical protein F511_39232 [Dorcoceras hygrometricum]
MRIQQMRRGASYGMSCDDISLDVITISRWLSIDEAKREEKKRRHVDIQQMAQRIEGRAKCSSRDVKSAAKHLTNYQSWMSTAELNSNGESDKKPAKEKDANLSGNGAHAQKVVSGIRGADECSAGEAGESRSRGVYQAPSAKEGNVETTKTAEEQAVNKEQSIVRSGPEQPAQEPLTSAGYHGFSAGRGVDSAGNARGVFVLGVSHYEPSRVAPTSHEMGNSRLSDLLCIWYRVLRRVGSSHIITHLVIAVDYRQSGPRPNPRFLRQAALEALTRSARTNTPRKTRPEQFPAKIVGGGGGAWGGCGGVS